MAKLGEEKNGVGWTNKIKVLRDGDKDLMPNSRLYDPS